MVILASQSPRRRELLGYIFDDFAVRPQACDETSAAPTPGAQALEVAIRKATAAAACHGAHDLVIAADTLVQCGDAVLGKPRDTADARRMLSMLSGGVCTVFTGVAVHTGGQIYGLTEQTDVTFYPLAGWQIDAYIATGEPMDKAGAFGIQNRGALLVRRIEGDFYNAIGLPVGALAQLLGQLGLLPGQAITHAKGHP